ncbi:MAG: CoA transferase, partial [Comamonadaceae bacterium]
APAVPLNLVGDYGGGALYLALGTVAAVAHVRAGGSGQVIDCAICDGTVSLLSLVHGLQHTGRWQDTRGGNVLDGGAPYYRCYRCADGGFVAVGAIEPAFHRILLERLGIDTPLFAQQHDRARWPEQANALAKVFGTRTRDEWAAVFAGTDACVAPVLTPAESRSDAHLLARGAFVALDGELQPAPVPRFGATPSRARPTVDVHAGAVLQAWRGQQVGVSP